LFPLPTDFDFIYFCFFADFLLDADILSSAELGPFHLQKPNLAAHYHRDEFLCHSSAQRRAQLSLDAFHACAGKCFDPLSTRMLWGVFFFTVNTFY
jgi:hypothetical protein